MIVLSTSCDIDDFTITATVVYQVWSLDAERKTCPKRMPCQVPNKSTGCTFHTPNISSVSAKFIYKITIEEHVLSATCVCVCGPPRVLIINDMICCDLDPI